jgi:hypothetical protein
LRFHGVFSFLFIGQAAALVAGFNARAGHDDLVLALSQLLLFLLGINELISSQTAGVKPFQENLGPTRWLLGECDNRNSRWFRAGSRNSRDHCEQLCPVPIKNLDGVAVIRIGELK